MVVPDRVRERRPENGDGRAEDEPRAVAVHCPDRVEERSRRVDVDPVALLEVGLGLAGHDSGEVEDDIGPGGDQGAWHVRIRQIRHDRLRSGRRRSVDGVDERQPGDVLAPESSFTSQAVGQLPAQHPRRAENDRAHGVTTAGPVPGPWPSCL